MITILEKDSDMVTLFAAITDRWPCRGWEHVPGTYLLSQHMWAPETIIFRTPKTGTEPLWEGFVYACVDIMHQPWCAEGRFLARTGPSPIGDTGLHRSAKEVWAALIEWLEESGLPPILGWVEHWPGEQPSVNFLDTGKFRHTEEETP